MRDRYCPLGNALLGLCVWTTYYLIAITIILSGLEHILVKNWPFVGSLLFSCGLVGTYLLVVASIEEYKEWKRKRTRAVR